MKIFILISLLSSFGLHAQSVVELDVKPSVDKVKLDIVRVTYDELDIFSLSQPILQKGGREFKLLCSFNPFYENRQSGLYHTADTIYRGDQFTFSDQDCLKVFNFFKKYFEYVSKDNPISITLDLNKRTVESFRLKKIDVEESEVPTLSLTP